jgi:hypothetical protein
MPIIIPDTNIMQIMGGHPSWFDWSENMENDPAFLKLPDWYQDEIRILSSINTAIPRCYSTAWVPPKSVIKELEKGSFISIAAKESLDGWGGEIVAWASEWFWDKLESDESEIIEKELLMADKLDLSFLPDNGDREIAKLAYALKAWYSIILTLDVKSFWRYKIDLAAISIDIRVPSELWQQMAPQL